MRSTLAISLVLLIYSTTQSEGCRQTVKDHFDQVENRKYTAPIGVQRTMYVIQAPTIYQPVCSTEGLFYVSTKAQCEYQNHPISCKNPLYPTTVARLTCRYGYRRRNDVITCRSNGTWDHEPWQQCEQICGVIDSSSSEAPWHATIFHQISGKYQQTCGGTIVSAKLVLTTGPCFRHSQVPSHYRIGVGNTHKYYGSSSSLPVQMLNIKKLVNSSTLRNSIIVIIVQDVIVFSPHIMPICIDNELHDEMITESEIHTLNAKIARYYYTPNGNELSVANLIITDRRRCSRKIKLNAPGRVMCAEVSEAGETLLCDIDNGSGVVVSKSIEGIETYSLFGIATTVTNKGPTCDTIRAMYVNHHEIQDLIKMGQDRRFYYTADQEMQTSSSEYCSSTIGWKNMLLVGCNYNGFHQPCDEPIISNTRARISCKFGYQIEGDGADVVVCNENGEWSHTLNRCVSTCTLPQLPLHLKAYYEADRTIEIRSGERVEELSAIIYECDNDYSRNGTEINHCERGEWYTRAPDCFYSSAMDGGFNIKPVGPSNRNHATCVLPELPPNLNQEIQVDDNVEYKVIYKCDEGYDLIGTREYFCNMGSRFVDVPTCVKQIKVPPPYSDVSTGVANPNDGICVLPELPPNLEAYDNSNAPLTGGHRFFGSVSVNYKCKTNYSLDGAAINSCQQGRWHSPTPVCKSWKITFEGSGEMRSHCTVPALTSNMKAYSNQILKRSGDRIEEFSSITYTCTDGYTLYGTSTNTCQRGQWKWHTAMCLPISSTTPPNDITEPDNADKLNCTLPALPSNMKAYYDTNPSVEITSGHLVEDGSSINYQCDSKYYINGTSKSTCHEGQWLSAMPNCAKRCLPVKMNGDTTKVNCLYNNVSTSCDERSLPGTVVHVTCHTYYKRPDVCTAGSSICGDDGRWTDRVCQCVENCGQIPPATSQFDDEKIIPWHVGIYTVTDRVRYQHICGGTIINRKVIASASQCFVTDSAIIDKTKVRVVAGKYYEDYNQSETLPTQIRNVSIIHIHSNYRGTQRFYNADMAILILSEYILFDERIMPICYDYNTQSIVLPDGIMAGWGVQNGKGELEVTNVQRMPTDECQKNSSPEYLPFITREKYCGVYNAGPSGRSVCDLNTGTGVANPVNRDGIRVYYIRGFVSSCPTADSMGNMNANVTVITDIYSHIEIIAKYASLYGILLV